MKNFYKISLVVGNLFYRVLQTSLSSFLTFFKCPRNETFDTFDRFQHPHKLLGSYFAPYSISF